MTIQISVHAEQAFQEWKTTVLRACEAVLSQREVDQGAMTIVLTDDETLRRVNLDFAGEDQATDVLSFPSGDVDPETGVPYLGDVLIAVPIAENQARQKGHSMREEISLLTIHGTLHLLGYDHADEPSREKMWSYQASAMHSLGLPDISEESS